MVVAALGRAFGDARVAEDVVIAVAAVEPVVAATTAVEHERSIAAKEIASDQAEQPVVATLGIAAQVSIAIEDVEIASADQEVVATPGIVEQVVGVANEYVGVAAFAGEQTIVAAAGIAEQSGGIADQDISAEETEGIAGAAADQDVIAAPGVAEHVSAGKGKQPADVPDITEQLVPAIAAHQPVVAAAGIVEHRAGGLAVQEVVAGKAEDPVVAAALRAAQSSRAVARDVVVESGADQRFVFEGSNDRSPSRVSFSKRRVFRGSTSLCAQDSTRHAARRCAQRCTAAECTA